MFALEQHLVTGWIGCKEIRKLTNTQVFLLAMLPCCCMAIHLPIFLISVEVTQCLRGLRFNDNDVERGQPADTPWTSIASLNGRADEF